ncbi:MAG TPA: hypothetical protein VJU61_22045, partial [Polyangiaceae bacterium]|nr:hypothetical protein [Polyangiaceae bacterium]
MQHRWALGMGFAALGVGALLGCSSASERSTGLGTRADLDAPGLPAEGDGAAPARPDVSGMDVPAGNEPAEQGSAADACIASAQFVPLGAVPDQYDALWKLLDPHAAYVYWTHEWSGNDVRIEHYRWTAAGGVENVDELLQLPVVEGEILRSVSAVSGDGGVLLASRLLEGQSTRTEAFRYTPETGAVALDFAPRTLSGDGSVALGLREGQLLRWTPEGGTAELALPGEMAEWSLDFAQLWSSESGDTVLGVGVLAGTEPHVLRWSAKVGWVDLGRLPVGAAGPATLGKLLSDAADVIVGTLGNPAEGGSRVFRWTESSGSTLLGALAGLPPEASYVVTHLSQD